MKTLFAWIFMFMFATPLGWAQEASDKVVLTKIYPVLSQCVAEQARRQDFAKTDDKIEACHTRIRKALPALGRDLDSGVTSRMVDASSLLYRAWDRQLNEVYAKFSACRQNPDIKDAYPFASFTKTQRAWAAFKDAEMQWESAKDGTAHRFTAVFLGADLTANRVFLLHSELDNELADCKENSKLSK